MTIRGALLSAVGLALLAVGILATELATQIGVALIVVGAGLFTVGVTLPFLSTFKVGAGGFEATLRERDAAIRAAVTPEQDRLAHLAAWLSADPAAAQDLLETALARTYARGPREEVKDEALRQLVRVAERHQPNGEGPPTAPAPAGERPPSDRVRGAFRALREVPPRQRSALVLDLLGDLTVDESARILGRTREKVEDDVAGGLARLPGLLARELGELL